MSSRHRLIVILTTCLAFIGIFASIKSDPNISTTVSSIVIRDNVEPSASQTPDPEFFKPTIDYKPKPVEITKIENDPISAKAYLVGNVETGKIYIEKNSKQALPVASMSKLVTAVTSTDIWISTTTIIVTPASTDVASDTSRLVVGDKFTLEEILYPLLLSSSNIAAEALALHKNRSQFMEMMSSYAWEIGAPDAFFADPSGISQYNIASAKDIFALGKYLYNNRRDILAITRNPSWNIATTTEHGSYDWKNTHPFVNDSRFLGGKTGRTPQAGDTMLTILEIKKEPLAFIVIGSRRDGRAEDTRLLIDKFLNITE